MSRIAIIMPLLILGSGCSSSDERLAQFARESSHEQAEQNERLAEGQREVAAGAKQLVTADAQARESLMTSQTQLREEAAYLQREREQLIVERGRLESQRQRDPQIAAAILEVGTILACLAPLILCVYLLRLQPREAEGELIIDTLVSQIVRESPCLSSESTFTFPRDDS